MSSLIAAALLASCASLAPPPAPVTVTVLSTVGVKAVLDEIKPAYERTTGNRLVIEYAVAAELKGRIEKGAPFDVTILTTAAIDDLEKQGKVAAGSKRLVAKSGAGVAIKTGAAKPDLSSAESFKSGKSDSRQGNGARLS